MDNLTPEQRKKNMQAIRAKGSKIELMFAKELWSRGFRYRKNNKSIFGKPDFSFKSFKVAIFCDSEFWHGKNWQEEKKRINTNPLYWTKKIQRNINRDKEVNAYLENEGWVVLRFWESEIITDVKSCVGKVEKIIAKRSFT